MASRRSEEEPAVAGRSATVAGCSEVRSLARLQPRQLWGRRRRMLDDRRPRRPRREPSVAENSETVAGSSEARSLATLQHRQLKVRRRRVRGQTRSRQANLPQRSPGVEPKNASPASTWTPVAAFSEARNLASFNTVNSPASRGERRANSAPANEISVNGAPVLSKRTPLCKKKPAPQARDAGNSKWRIGGSNP